MTEAKVCGVIVTFNRSSLLLKTLEAVLTQSVPISQLVIVDNCSTDSTQDALENAGFVSHTVADGATQHLTLDSGVDVICFRSAENLGGSYGFYKGLKIAHGLDNEFVWMMDDDVVPSKDCLEKLLACIDENACVCIPNRVGDGFVDTAKTDFDLKSLFKLKLDDKKSLISADEIDETYLVVKDMPFEGPLMKTCLIDEAGLPNKDLFLIFDDTEYATRLSKITSIRFVVDAHLYRQLPMIPSNARNLDWKDYYRFRNEFWFDHTYGLNWPVRELRPRLYMLGLLIKKSIKLQTDDLAVIKRAYKDGMSGNLGKTVDPGEF